ncbi:TspO/MBR family protein [Amycolatopsis mongoliensis]|uniref:TspO/MBR family protein n=1 Tax=Amycolatopsis mongoliensis TaxID=715475 RepID=A0A9Y2JJE3_9PSEU|nr:TspO/MBR family protein [Amycolatopsis sp. 4-36]WIX98376.1 TspO/MBR family protein [Amycolatopsis sp. 4-36]
MTTLTRSARASIALVAFLAAVAAVAVVGGLAASQSREVYAGLVRPSWAPPPWLFGPVWTVLYVLIAFSGWLFWRSGGLRGGLRWYAAGLLLNATWTPLFFGGGAYALALLDVVALDAVIVATVVVFRRRSPAAAAMQLPYLAWAVFATALNAAIVLLN